MHSYLGWVSPPVPLVQCQAGPPGVRQAARLESLQACDGQDSELLGVVLVPGQAVAEVD